MSISACATIKEDMLVMAFMDVVPNRDGHYSIQFVDFNLGINNISEITKEFSKHGEAMKVIARGAKNAVNRVILYFADHKAAFIAFKAQETSEDFVAINFAWDCLKETTSPANI